VPSGGQTTGAAATPALPTLSPLSPSSSTAILVLVTAAAFVAVIVVVLIFLLFFLFLFKLSNAVPQSAQGSKKSGVAAENGTPVQGQQILRENPPGQWVCVHKAPHHKHPAKAFRLLGNGSHQHCRRLRNHLQSGSGHVCF
jgi:hypothetical protein